MRRRKHQPCPSWSTPVLQVSADVVVIAGEIEEQAFFHGDENQPGIPAEAALTAAASQAADAPAAVQMSRNRKGAPTAQAQPTHPVASAFAKPPARPGEPPLFILIHVIRNQCFSEFTLWCHTTRDRPLPSNFIISCFSWSIPIELFRLHRGIHIPSADTFSPDRSKGVSPQPSCPWFSSWRRRPWH